MSGDTIELVPEELQGLDFEEIKSRSGPISMLSKTFS